MWLTQQLMSDLYQTSRTNIVEHIKHIYEDGELTEEATCRKFRQVRLEGNRNVEREIPHYNLDMIISLHQDDKIVYNTLFLAGTGKKYSKKCGFFCQNLPVSARKWSFASFF